MVKIKIIGLGPREFHHLTLQTINLLKNDKKLFLRTEIHPLVEEFPKHNISYESCDSFYEECDDFNQVYNRIATFIINKAREYKEIQYAVPGDPLALETTVELILRLAKDNNIEVNIVPSLGALDAIYAYLKTHPSKGLIVLDAISMPNDYYWAGKQVLITQVYSKLV